MKKRLFYGVGTALITPFKNGKVDFVAFEIIISKQIEAGVDAIIVLGTTGEAPTITYNERKKIIEFAVRICRGRCKVIVGCGSNNTKTAIKYYKMAERLGADSALVVTPYYNKCTDNGLFAYYSEIASAGKLPIICYNVPSRTGVNISAKCMEKLAEIKNIVGIKEASGNIAQINEMFRLVGKKIAIYSGDDALNYIFLVLGGDGCISVLSNIMPKACKRLYNIYKTKSHKDACEYWLEFLPLIKSLFVEVNPTPIKYALSYIGLCNYELRSPLVQLENQNEKEIQKQVDLMWGRYESM